MFSFDRFGNFARIGANCNERGALADHTMRIHKCRSLGAPRFGGGSSDSMDPVSVFYASVLGTTAAAIDKRSLYYSRLLFSWEIAKGWPCRRAAPRAHSNRSVIERQFCSTELPPPQHPC